MNPNTGEVIGATNRIIQTSLIPVQPNETYYFNSNGPVDFAVIALTNASTPTRNLSIISDSNLGFSVETNSNENFISIQLLGTTTSWTSSELLAMLGNDTIKPEVRLLTTQNPPKLLNKDYVQVEQATQEIDVEDDE